MPLTGTRDLSGLAAEAPLLPNLDTEPWELQNAQHLQLQYELGSESRTNLLPPALHPSVPATLLINVTHVPESEVGPFTMSTVRVGCRSGARPRGLLVHGFCDSEAAIAALRDHWGFPLERADVTLHPSYDHAATSVAIDGRLVLEGALVDPHPISGADIQYLATLNLARLRRDGTEQLRLVQADPEYVFHRAQRGQPRLTAFEAEAWSLPGARAAHPISASLTVVDLTLPRLRYLVDPEKPPLEAVERLPEAQSTAS